MSTPIQPQFPIFIPSKSRWMRETRLTVRCLERIGVKDYTVIVEQQQYPDYADVIDPKHLVILDPEYQRSYETFDDLGFTKSLGPGPARNMAWDLAIERGAAWHWVMDDNIRHFVWRINNREHPAADPAIFVAMEEFVLHWKNVAMAGPNYCMFAPARHKLPPYTTGTRIYSCNMIRNDLPYRWRGRYNEDTDLSLRMLKDGWATVQFYAFLQEKINTQKIQGGNTEAFYAAEGTAAKSQMLVAMHPDVAEVKFKFSRIHHEVDYSRWRGQKLIPADNPPPKRQWTRTLAQG